MKLSTLKRHLDLPDDYDVSIGQNTEGFYLFFKSPRKYSEDKDGVVERKLYFR